MSFCFFYSPRFPTSNVGITLQRGGPESWEMAETHPSRKKRKKKWPDEGNHPHTLGNELPACGLRPSLPGSRPRVTRAAERDAGCTLAHCLPTAAVINGKQMATIP